jgi:hypothetical protein
MKFLKWFLIVVAILGVLGFAGWQIMIKQTKKASPETTEMVRQGDTKIEVFYNRPSKRGRRIFGDLVPYGEVWRTGANEATAFSTNVDLSVMGQTLPKGDYTLWTIPGKISWKVIWNNKQYPWGVNWEGQASREAEFDVLELEVPTHKLSKEIEMFTISLDSTEPIVMRMEWEETGLVIPMQVK